MKEIWNIKNKTFSFQIMEIAEKYNKKMCLITPYPPCWGESNSHPRIMVVVNHITHDIGQMELVEIY